MNQANPDEEITPRLEQAEVEVGNQRKMSLIFGAALILLGVGVELWNLFVEKCILGNHFVIQFAIIALGIILIRKRSGFKLKSLS